MSRTQRAAHAQKQPRKAHPRLKKALHLLGLTVAVLLLVTLFYLAVILGQPEEAENPITVSKDQPLLTASPALNIQTEHQVATLAQSFPVPILAFMQGMGPVLVSGSSYDQAFEGGFARLTELQYQTDNGLDCTLTTIYPARALSLMGKGSYVLTGAATQNLVGLVAVRMEDGQHIRLHAQANDALYVLTVPQVSDDTLTAMTRVLELVQAEQ